MQLRAEQLAPQLKKSLAAAYLVHGDEPLLALEAADAIRGAARAKGYAERVVLEPGRAFDWSEFQHATANLSLFGGKKLVELRLPSGKPAAGAVSAIVAYCARPNPDVTLLVTMPRPDAPGWWKSEWFLALERAGAVVEVQPVARAQLPAWIAERLARQGQSAPREVLEHLADRVEGNLLAAHQEVQKLALLAPQGELSLDAVQEAVANVARFSPHAAAEALLAANPARYARVLAGLQSEGEQPTFVLFVLSSVLFVLRGARRGAPFDALFSQHRLFDKGLQRAAQAAAKRYSGAALAAALAQAALVDRAIKGVAPGEPWEELLKLGLNLAGGASR
ncbi:MAG TPA: DNA polymerase III subunit delta [Burkholderiales bacterium]|nr:DNA polymerase III subunit delta [Burkholderiales bacterium]